MSLTFSANWSRCRKEGSSSFMPAVPPACSGNERYPADNHGHFDTTVMLVAGP